MSLVSAQAERSEWLKSLWNSEIEQLIANGTHNLVEDAEMPDHEEPATAACQSVGKATSLRYQ